MPTPDATALAPFHVLSWYAGWGQILLGFLTGAGLGLGFHRAGFLGGYDSLRRRLTRLGHIALVALGMLQLLFAASPWPPDARAAELCLAAGGLAMPTVCFLSAWRLAFRHLFFLPVALLCAAVVLILLGGSP